MINPNGMDFRDWAAGTALALGAYGSVVPPMDNWKLWASTIALDPRLNKFNVPSPYPFEEWESWAMAFNNSLIGVPL